jgi:hypothetical protein
VHIHVLAAAAAVAGLLQLIASVALGLATPSALVRAAREGPQVYIVVAFLVAAGVWGAVALRRRPPLALASALVGPLALGLLIWRGSFTRLGAAYHGELILHHFLAFVCAAAAAAIPLQWIRDRRLGRLRWLSAVSAVPGALLLLAEHLTGPLAAEPASPIGQVGTAMSLATWPIALVVLWPALGPLRLRLWLASAALPAAVRVALGGAAALAGVPLGLAAAAPVMAAVVAASVAGLLLLRPQVDRVLQVLATAGAAVMTLGLYRVYLQRFGDLEGDLGGLVRSLFGFDLPYPGYVPEWRLSLAMLGLFVLLTTVSGALISGRDHVRGLGLALMVTAGLGLTSPQLTLMLTAGFLVLVDATAGTPADPAARPEPPPAPLDEIFAAAAARLGLLAPVALEQAAGRVLVVRGEVERAHVHLRARDGRRGPQLELTVGVPGRDRPEVELLAGDDGARVRGNVRRLESLPEALLVALAGFPQHRLRLWSGGAHLDFGARLARLDERSLAELILRLAGVV